MDYELEKAIMKQPLRQFLFDIEQDLVDFIYSRGYFENSYYIFKISR